MSRRSEQIRAQRHAKQAQRWPDSKKPEAWSRRFGLAKNLEIGVECFAGDPSLPVGVAPGSLPLPE